MKKIFIIISVLFTFWIACSSSVISEFYDVQADVKKLIVKNIGKSRDKNPLYREFRASWFSTVKNIDFPLQKEDEEAQKLLIVSHLNKLKENNFNAVFVQVKPDAGTIYPSKINPTTRYFFSDKSIDEKDEYPFKTDLLAFLIEEAHIRNIEVHAWLNPYRISLTYDTNQSYAQQFSKKNFVHTYVSNGYKPIFWGDKRLYIDPGEPISKSYVIASAMEVLENYDVDGIHFDDYFYQNAAAGKTYKDWPDDVSASKYAEKDGFNPNDKKDDDYGRDGLFAWRRHNINTLVSEMYEEIKKRKPYVKWTISPAGVWRNNVAVSYIPASKNGSATKVWNTNFDTLHADVLLWLANGQKTDSMSKAGKKDGLGKKYVDAIIPQIYWTDDNELAPFNTIADWWIKEAKKISDKKRADIYVGHALYKVGSLHKTEILWTNMNILSKQVDYLRKNGNDIIKGSAFFTTHNMYYNDRDTKDYGAMAISNVLKNNYIFRAIVPTLSSLEKTKIPPPKNIKVTNNNYMITIKWTDTTKYALDYFGHPSSNTVIYYAIYRKNIQNGYIELLDTVRRRGRYNNTEESYTHYNLSGRGKYIYYVTALDRLHNESKYAKSKKIYIY